MTETFKPTERERKQVLKMTGLGIPHAQMCLVIRDGIDAKTLRKHFRLELDTGKAHANVMVVGKLFDMAMDGNIAAVIFWCKSQLGMKEKIDVDLSLTTHEAALKELE